MRRKDEPIFGTLLMINVCLAFFLAEIRHIKDGMDWTDWASLIVGAGIAFSVCRSIYFDRIKS